MTRFETMTNDELRAYAAESRRNAYDSFERCDTDGSLSQAASTTMADVAELQIHINENGGRAEFLALFDLDGNVVPAEYRKSNHYGRPDYWLILDREADVRFFTPSQAKKEGVARKNDAKRGFYVGYAMFPAFATTGGNRTSFWAKAERHDDRDFSDVVPVDNGHIEGPSAEHWYRVQDGRFDRGE